MSSWALQSGLPSSHTIRAALHVASILDSRGSRVVDAHESYWHHATGGAFPPPDMRRGEDLLVDCGLVVRDGGVLFPTSQLHELLDGAIDDAAGVLVQRSLEISEPPWILDRASRDADLDEMLAPLIPDPLRREETLIALGRRFDDTQRKAVGELGEQAVVRHARNELSELGHEDLAREVRRVSLQSDQLGYDVVAPRIVGARRLLEVKTSSAQDRDRITFYLSRNEARVGANYSDWALVFCTVVDRATEDVEIRGWCPFSSIEQLLPIDTDDGRWEVANVQLAVSVIFSGIPLPSG